MTGRDQHLRSCLLLLSEGHHILWLGLIGGDQDGGEAEHQASFLLLLHLGLNLNP